jgi:hypothetical protein
VVGGEFVQKDDGRSAAHFLEIETDIVAGDGIGHLLFLLIEPCSDSELKLYLFCFDAFSSREPAASSLKTLHAGRAGRPRKSQLTLTAAMRRNRFFFVTE